MPGPASAAAAVVPLSHGSGAPEHRKISSPSYKSDSTDCVRPGVNRILSLIKSTFGDLLASWLAGACARAESSLRRHCTLLL